MAQVTQCPACSTRFRVVDDQLKISEGWVRCGRCGEVFDARQALATLESLTAPPAEPPLTAPSPVEPPPAVPWGDGAAAPDLDIVIGDDGAVHEVQACVAAGSVGANEVPVATSAAPIQPAPEAPEIQEPQGSQETQETPHLAEGADASNASATSSALDASGASDGNVASDAAADVMVGVLPETPPGGLAEESEVSFLRAARRQAFWGQAWVRSALGALALVLGLTLAAQVVWLERDRVAAAAPGLKPWLVAACQTLGCEVGHWRHIESVRLDGTALVQLKGGGYRLEVGLNNTAQLPVALPALELSLTNARDEVVLRRVILPAEWANPTDVLPPSGTVNLNVNLSVAGRDTLATAGYRALVFYP